MDHYVISENIKRIRSYQGLSQKAVATKAELSLSAYAKIERGTAQPRVRNLEAISRALDVPLMSLLAPVRELHDIRFRANKKLRSRAQVLANVGRWIDEYNDLEGLLNEARPYKLADIGQRMTEDECTPKKAAQLVRRELGLTDYEPIRDISGLLDTAGIKTFPMALASEHFFGLSIGPKSGGPAVVVNTWDRISVERRIFTAAHELGHLVLHQSDFGIDDPEENPAHEGQANEFAAEFLMPDEVFRREWKEASGLSFVERVIKVKRIFKVSYKTVLVRLAPFYKGPFANIYAHFHSELKRERGKGLDRHEEPSAIVNYVQSESSEESDPTREPESLSSSDFREDRLAYLVRKGLEDGEISMGRAAEILGLSLMDMRSLTMSWVV